MRIFALTVLVLGLAGVLVAGAASASAQEADETLDELSSAGIPLLNSAPAPVQQQVPPGQPGPAGQPPPDTLVDLPIPDPTDWIPNPLDWLPGGLNPVSWAKDIVNAVFTLIGQAMLEAIRGFVDWALGMGGSSLNFVTRTPAEGTYDSPTVRSLYDFSRAIVNVALAVVHQAFG